MFLTPSLAGKPSWRRLIRETFGEKWGKHATLLSPLCFFAFSKCILTAVARIKGRRREAKVFPCAFQGKRRVGDFGGPTKGAAREVGMIARKASPPFIPRPGLTKNKPPTLFLSSTHTPFSLSICRPKKNPRGNVVFCVAPFPLLGGGFDLTDRCCYAGWNKGPFFISSHFPFPFTSFVYCADMGLSLPRGP